MRIKQLVNSILGITKNCDDITKQTVESKENNLAVNQ